MTTTWLLVTSLLSWLLWPAVWGRDTASLCSSLSPCSRPLGVETGGHLPDLSITASSSYSSSVRSGSRSGSKRGWRGKFW